MTTLTADILRAIMPLAGHRADTYAPLLQKTADRFDISKPKRMAAYLAQLAHESGQLVYVRELASGAAYEGRQDLGNVNPGDGERYRGRGLIQITGRRNYRAASIACGVDFEGHPELMEEPENACLVSAWFWYAHGLSSLADHDDFRGITRIINGGLNGEAEREAFFARAKVAFGIA